MIKQAAKAVFDCLTHLIGRLTGRYYFEDYLRVYPDRTAYNRFGKQKAYSRNDYNNFLNHCKFYQFCGQFVKDQSVADVGCGSGYGCELLANSGAGKVCGCDVSKHALDYAKQHFGDRTDFTNQTITDLKLYADNCFDIVISSEVLEHIKEYGLDAKAVAELRRITRPGGLVIVGTPNSELLGDHGFSFHEINRLFDNGFESVCIFENALVPFGAKQAAWEARLRAGETGVIISQQIKLSETVLPEGVVPTLKEGTPAGVYEFDGIDINTRILHNTHSWIVVAKK